MKLTLLRHGQVDKTYLHRYNGHIDISLSEQGHVQAARLGEHFKDKAFDAVFCSDLKRCRQTLQAFKLDITPVYTQALREKSWGRHEGKSFDEIIASEVFVYESFEQWINCLDGEDYIDYIRRIENFFTGFLPANPYDNVLIITHAGVIRVLMHLFQKISLEEAFSRPFSYAHYITLDTDTGKFGEMQCV